MPNTPTRRAQARTAQIAQIKQTARRLLAVHGAGGLSLREVSREMGMVSSSLYRYFASRDELLTALIEDAFNDLGAYVEAIDAALPPDAVRQRFLVCSAAVRDWALANRHEYALIYGSPVPGYSAPATTIGPAMRVTTALSAILQRAYQSSAAESTAATADTASAANPAIRRAVNFDVVGPAMPDVPDEMVLRGLIVWSQLFGAISFELFGHFEGSVADLDQMFVLSTAEMADFLGIRADG